MVAKPVLAWGDDWDTGAGSDTLKLQVIVRDSLPRSGPQFSCPQMRRNDFSRTFLPALICQGPRWQLLDLMPLGGTGLEHFIKKVNNIANPLHAFSVLSATRALWQGGSQPSLQLGVGIFLGFSGLLHEQLYTSLTRNERGGPWPCDYGRMTGTHGRVAVSEGHSSHHTGLWPCL